MQSLHSLSLLGTIFCHDELVADRGAKALHLPTKTKTWIFLKASTTMCHEKNAECCGAFSNCRPTPADPDTFGLITHPTTATAW